MGALTDLPNIGAFAEKNLIAAGITTPEQLRETGAEEAYLRVRAVDPGA